jgi:hypothetical protein
VRIEVTDTGCGIKQEDMVQGGLFCELYFLREIWETSLRRSANTAAFNQTEQGRQQGK